MTEMIIVAVFLLILSVEDFIWNEVHLLLLLAFVLSGTLYWIIVRQVSLNEMLGGALTGAVIMLYSFYASGELGSADGIVFLATGIFLGFRNNLLLVLVSMFIAGIAAAAALVLFKSRRKRLPLIPFITAGAVFLIGVNS